MILCTLLLPLTSNSKGRRHLLLPVFGEHVDLPKQTLYASILWRGAQKGGASFLAGDWLWQNECSKDGNHLHLLLCCMDDDTQRKSNRPAWFVAQVRLTGKLVPHLHIRSDPAVLGCERVASLRYPDLPQLDRPRNLYPSQLQRTNKRWTCPVRTHTRTPHCPGLSPRLRNR